MADPQPENQENYRMEYKEVVTSHRFYVGLRFIIAAFTATLQSALLKLYSDALIPSTQFPDILMVGYRFTLGSHPISIATVGLMTIVAVFFMERRNISRFRIMIERGKELEFKLLLPLGQFHKLGEYKEFELIIYTRGLTAIYCAIGVMWIYLLILNTISLAQKNFP